MWGLKGDYKINDKNRLAVTWANGDEQNPQHPFDPSASYRVAISPVST